ncbi:MAG TPA: hypothetical protein V6C95_08270 [Coleofasciculaceae cyanobacterium]
MIRSITSNEANQPLSCQNEACSNLESLKPDSSLSKQEYQNLNGLASHPLQYKQDRWFGTPLHPDQIPLSRMELELKTAIAQIQPYERHNVAREFLKQLHKIGLTARDLQPHLSLSTDQVKQMSADDVTRLASFTYHTYPHIFQDVVAEQTAIVKFFSNSLVGAVLGVIASKWLGDRR